jgi:GTP 3',8-cyclase
MLLVGKAGAARGGSVARDGQLDSLDDGVFRAMNDRDVPLARVPEGIAIAHKAGLLLVKLNTVVKRGSTTTAWSTWPASPASTPERAVLRIRGRGHDQRLARDDVVPAAEVIRRIDAELPSRGGPPS